MRNPSGIYELPNPDVVPNTTISSTVENSTLADIENDLNFPRPLVAGGTGATSAAAARANLQAERSMQVVTNFDSATWESGSFTAATSATGSPVAGHAFMGVAVVVDANNIVLRAQDQNDTQVPGRSYIREKKAGVWSAWSVGDGSDRVLRAGDTMTGNLTIAPAVNAALTLSPAAGNASINLVGTGSNNGAQIVFNAMKPGNNLIYGFKESSQRWLMVLGDAATESGANAGSNFVLNAYSDAAAYLGTALNINRANLMTTFGGELTVSPIGTARMILNKQASGNVSGINGQMNGALRWSLQLGDASAEGGSADGSAFTLFRFDNAGNTLGAVMSIDRAGGRMSYVGDISINKASPSLVLNKSAGANYIYGTHAGLTRWRMDISDGVQDDFILHRFDLANAYLGSPLHIARATGQFTLTGNVRVNSSGTGYTQIGIDAPVGQPCWLTGTKGSAARWQIDLGDGSAESGGNAGSNFYIHHYADNGAYLGQAMNIMRNNKAVTFGGSVDAVSNFLCRQGAGGATSGYTFNFNWNGSQFFAYVQTSNVGQIQFVSDYRIKDNIAELPSMWDTVAALRPIRYTQKEWTPPWEEEAQAKSGKPFIERDDRERWGFIAHELQDVLLATAATGHKDAQNLIQSPDPWPLLAAAVKVLQELMARVEALEAIDA